MAIFFQLLIAGIATGAIYALIAVGFSLLWQTSETINFAYTSGLGQTNQLGDIHFVV